MKYIIIVMLILMSTLVLAENPVYSFKESSSVDLKVFCFASNETICAEGNTCQINIMYPNQTIMVDNGSMSRTSNYYNYSLTPSQTSIQGEYASVVTCQGDTDGYATFFYEITDRGSPSSDEVRGSLVLALTFIIIIGLLINYFTIYRVSKILGSFVVFIAGIVTLIIFIGTDYVLASFLLILIGFASLALSYVGKKG